MDVKGLHITETELKLGFELTALQGDAEKQQGDSHPVQGKTPKMPHLPDRIFNQTGCEQF